MCSPPPELQRPPSQHPSLETGSGLSSTCLLILPFIYDDRDGIPAGKCHGAGVLSIFLSRSALLLICFFIMLLFLYLWSRCTLRTLSNFSRGCTNTDTGTSDYLLLSSSSLLNLLQYEAFPKGNTTEYFEVHTCRKRLSFNIIPHQGTTIMDLK